jgi:hypothetical protein
MAVYHENGDESLAGIQQVLERVFFEAGIQSVTYNAEGVSLEHIQTACDKAGARWGLMARTSLKDGRLYWHFSIYDAQDRAIQGSDSFDAAFLAGISSQGAIESSAYKVASQWEKSRSAQDFDGRFAVDQGQRFTAGQERVMVYFGGEDGIFLGSIQGGSLAAPRFLFTQGEPVYGTVMKTGYWTRNFTLPQGITDKPAPLPALQKVTRHSFGFSYQFQGTAEYSFNLEYRYHLLSDRLFLEFNWGFWLSFDSSGEKPFLGQEVVFKPLGLYLLPKRDLPVRLVAGTGASLMLPDQKIPKPFFYPLWVDAEYHFPQFILKAELKVPLLLDAFSWYYQPPQDIWRFDPLGFYCSVGVMLKW